MRLPSFLRPYDSEGSTGANGGSAARSRIRTTLAVLLACDAVLLFFVFRPPSRSLAERETELARSKAQHETILNTVKQMRDLRAKFQTAIQNDQEFSRVHFLQRKTAFSAMVTDLEKLATQSQLKTSSIGYAVKEDSKDESKQQGFVNVEVTMTIDGQYADLVQFINRLEQSDLFWITDSMTVAPSTGRGLRLTIKMATYAMAS